MNACCITAIATIALACLCLTPVAPSGCAVYRAAAAPSRKDLSILKSGTARNRVIAEQSPPMRTEKVGDSRKDVFTFVQGHSTASKSGVAAIIALEDIATLGAAELALGGSGAENAGEKIMVAVYYDASDVVTRSETILVTQP
jgi:hypothetical protein